MLKVFLLLKRNPALTMEEFIDHYENIHVRLASQRGSGGSKIQHYERHYLRPAPFYGDGALEPEYDCITELWYKDMAEFNEITAFSLQHPEGRAAIMADEEILFDRPKIRRVFVEDRETVIPTPEV